MKETALHCTKYCNHVLYNEVDKKIAMKGVNAMKKIYFTIAGRLYDKIADEAEGIVKYVVPNGVLCELVLMGRGEILG